MIPFGNYHIYSFYVIINVKIALWALIQKWNPVSCYLDSKMVDDPDCFQGSMLTL